MLGLVSLLAEFLAVSCVIKQTKMGGGGGGLRGEALSRANPNPL